MEADLPGGFHIDIKIEQTLKLVWSRIGLMQLAAAIPVIGLQIGTWLPVMMTDIRNETVDRRRVNRGTPQ
jgi:hypothetical protein